MEWDSFARKFAEDVSSLKFYILQMLYDCFDWFGFSQILEFKRMDNKF